MKNYHGPAIDMAEIAEWHREPTTDYKPYKPGMNYDLLAGWILFGIIGGGGAYLLSLI